VFTILSTPIPLVIFFSIALVLFILAFVIFFVSFHGIRAFVPKGPSASYLPLLLRCSIPSAAAFILYLLSASSLIAPRSLQHLHSGSFITFGSSSSISSSSSRRQTSILLLRFLLQLLQQKFGSSRLSFAPASLRLSSNRSRSNSQLTLIQERTAPAAPTEQQMLCFDCPANVQGSFSFLLVQPTTD
jgi:hypothetical protein